MIIKTSKTFLFLILILTFSCKEKKKDESTIKKSEEIMSTDQTQTFKSEKTIASHSAKAQYYRWYQLYERPMNKERIANQMDLFTDDLIIENAVDTLKGKENYPARLTVYEGWKNAHHVQNVSFVTNSDGSNEIVADIRYQNIQPDGKKASYTLDYIMKLDSTTKELPKLAKVIIKPTGVTEDEFKDSYSTNRVNSLMYCWLAYVERLDGNVTPFKELLTEDFELNFSTSSQIKTIEQLEGWLNGTPKQLSQSSHYPENITIKEINEHTFELSVVFDWYGIAKNGQKMKVKTSHKWIIIDDINERFAKIKKIDVSQIEPLSMVK